MTESVDQKEKSRLAFNDLIAVPAGAGSGKDQEQKARRRQRQLRQAGQRREQLLDVALDLFHEAGLQGFNMRELGLRAGYTPGALYAYFDGKAAILQALRERLLKQLALALQHAVPLPRSVSRDRSGATVRPPEHVADGLTVFLQLSLAWWRWLGLDGVRWRLLLSTDPSGDLASVSATGLGKAAQGLMEPLCEATAPCRDALRVAGLSPEQARDIQQESLAFGVGLLVLGPAGMGDPALEERFLCGLRRMLSVTHPLVDAAARPQGDLFGL